MNGHVSMIVERLFNCREISIETKYLVRWTTKHSSRTSMYSPLKGHRGRRWIFSRIGELIEARRERKGDNKHRMRKIPTPTRAMTNGVNMH